MSEVRANNLTNANQTGGPTLSGITTFSGTHFFVPPQGNTAERPQSSPIGALRFNTDSSHLEYYRGDTIGWTEIEAELTKPLGGGTGSNEGLGTRMLAGGGDLSSGTTNSIDFITISTFGNGQDFGDLTRSSTGAGGSASRTRGLFANRYASPSYHNEIDFVTIASKGNAQDFGNSTVTNGYCRGLSNQIRSCTLAFASINTINYVNIATTGDAQDFGDQTGVLEGGSACASTTRGILAGGGNIKRIDYITIMTTGNAQDFGDLSANVTSGNGLSNSTRGVHKIMFQSGATNAMEFITIATLGNSQDFGDALNVGPSVASGASPTRGLFSGGSGVSSPYPKTDVIQKIEILSQGNSIDFGDMSFASNHPAGLTNGHGGL